MGEWVPARGTLSSSSIVFDFHFGFAGAFALLQGPEPRRLGWGFMRLESEEEIRDGVRIWGEEGEEGIECGDCWICTGEGS